MKRILALLGFALLPIIATAQTSEPELLSYTQEVEIKGANANQLYKWFCDWEQEYGTSYGIGIVEPNRVDNILKLHVTKYNIKRGLHCYGLIFDIYTFFQDGKYLLDLTNICAIDRNGWDSYYKPIRKDQKCKTIRNILEQYFSDLQSSIYTVITAYAEMELPLKKEFSAEFEVPGVSCEQLVHLARFYVDTELWRGLSCSYLSHEKVQDTVQFRLNKLPLDAGYVTNVKLSIQCYDGRYTIKMTDIEPKCKEADSWKVYRPRRYYAETLSEMESNIFPTICKIVHDVMASSK